MEYNSGFFGRISNAVLTSVVYAAQTSHVSCEIIKSGLALRRFFLCNSKIFFSSRNRVQVIVLILLLVFFL